MAEEQDLDLLLPFRPEAEHDQLEQPPQRPVQKRERDPLPAACHGRWTRPVTRGARRNPTPPQPSCSAPTACQRGRIRSQVESDQSCPSVTSLRGTACPWLRAGSLFE